MKEIGFMLIIGVCFTALLIIVAILEEKQLKKAVEKASQIVRCKDCKNVEQDETTKSLWCGITMVFPEDFCSRGKKAEK